MYSNNTYKSIYVIFSINPLKTCSFTPISAFSHARFRPILNFSYVRNNTTVPLRKTHPSPQKLSFFNHL